MGMQGQHMYGQGSEMQGNMMNRQMLSPEQQMMMQNQQQMMYQQQVSQPLVDLAIFNEGYDKAARRELIGNAIYHILHSQYGDKHTSKITGMLIDNEAVVDQTALVTDAGYLATKAQEAFNLLNRPHSQDQGQH